MPVTTEKITDTVSRRLKDARHMMDTKVVPYAIPAGRRAAEQAARQAQITAQQVQHTVKTRVVPMAVTAVGSAMIASAPARHEAMRRGQLAAAALRGVEVVSIRRRRRWPVALASLLLGGAIGAAAAWLAQAGKPVQLTPYPLSTDKTVPEAPPMSDTTLDLTEDADHPA